MNNSEKVDFNFRYRPTVDSADGILFTYLQGIPPKERKFMIVKALRAFYFISAYGASNDINSPDELLKFANQVREIYGDDYSELERLRLKLELRIEVEDWEKFSLEIDDPESGEQKFLL
ncbi:MAG: hypothetical protein AAGK10_08210 [Cyanobacteria bacterium J06555_3]